MTDDPTRRSPRDGDASPTDRHTARSLGPIVEQEARRMLSETQLTPDPARVADGWERRFIADGQRAKEMMALYRDLGFEVCADPITPEQVGDDCADCRLLMLLDFKTIYTRKAKFAP
ncbi:MAG: hypothetical protein OEO20_10775 [Gemmatimonadota bacterium]|nr:hypothetical protein [Gemmatimonadota bacterium]MDH3478777.1 hypothetical protein [Gemmatimonadota bacterium]MDH3568840.1 hypothetical protein [Gemmatimonadota bacterium]